MQKSLLMIGVLCFTLIMVSCKKNIDNEIKKTPQDNLIFVPADSDKTTKIVEGLQSSYKEKYLIMYYSTWDNPGKVSPPIEIKNTETLAINNLLKSPGWGENKRPLDRKYFEIIQGQMDLDNLPNTKKKGMTIRKTNLRVLPTDKPTFTNFTDPGEGYPFDNLQASFLQNNQPVYIAHTSKNGEWSLITTLNYSTGWVHSRDLALVDDVFIQHWKTQNYVIATQDDSTVRDEQGNFQLLTRIGELFPLAEESDKFYRVLVAVTDINGQAFIKTGLLNKNVASRFPLIASQKNIATIANEFMGAPYGWGGLYGYRDCSLTLIDLFANFGIALPRSSDQQALMGKYISLEKLSNAEKRQTIIKLGIPFFTFITMPGHVMLYVGHKKDVIYVFHSLWGIHTESASTGEEGRIIIGRTIIAPLDLGKDYAALTELDRTTGMTLLLDKKSPLTH